MGERSTVIPFDEKERRAQQRAERRAGSTLPVIFKTETERGVRYLNVCDRVYAEAYITQGVSYLTNTCMRIVVEESVGDMIYEQTIGFTVLNVCPLIRDMSEYREQTLHSLILRMQMRDLVSYANTSVDERKRRACSDINSEYNKLLDWVFAYERILIPQDIWRILR